MRLTDKRFWIWEIVTTFLLSALPLALYGENVTVTILVFVSYAVAAAIGLVFSKETRTVLAWILIFVASVSAYIIDLFLIGSFRLIKMELYPLIVGQIYVFPIYILTSGTICIIGGIIMSKSYKIQRRK